MHPTSSSRVIASLAGALVLFGASVAAAEDVNLQPSEIRQRMGAVDPDIQRCYRDAFGARGGRFEVKVVIDPTGFVEDVNVTARRLSAASAKKLQACVRRSVIGLHFPVRDEATVAVIPYQYQRTVVAGAGSKQSRPTAAKPRRG